MLRAWPAACALLALACASAPPPVIPLAALRDGAPEMQRGRFTIHVAEGDELALHLRVEGDLVVADPAEPLLLRARRPFYVHVGDGPPWISLDPEGRERQRGSLNVALGESAVAGISATLTVRTPITPEP